jgi:hypothetical protein
MALPLEDENATGQAYVPRPFRYTTNISVLAALLNHGKEKKLPNTILRNISCSGAGIHSQVSLPIGETISLHFYLPESGRPFRALCSVIWSDSQGHCGVRFQQVSERHMRRLNTWLTSKAAEQESNFGAMPLGTAISEFGQ